MPRTTATENPDDLKSIMDALNELRLENKELKESVSRLQDRTPQGPPPEKTPQVSLPNKFDGNRADYRSFVSQLRLVWQLQPLRYPTDALKIGLLGTLLSGPALAWMAPLLNRTLHFSGLSPNLSKSSRPHLAKQTRPT